MSSYMKVIGIVNDIEVLEKNEEMIDGGSISLEPFPFTVWVSYLSKDVVNIMLQNFATPWNLVTTDLSNEKTFVVDIKGLNTKLKISVNLNN